jgi:hypothetical protein
MYMYLREDLQRIARSAAGGARPDYSYYGTGEGVMIIDSLLFSWVGCGNGVSVGVIFMHATGGGVRGWVRPLVCILNIFPIFSRSF